MLSNEDLLAISTLLDQKLESVKKDTADLKDDMIDLKRDVTGIKSDVAGLKGDVTGLKGDVSGLKDDVSGLKDDVSGLKGDVSGLKGDVSGLKGEIASLRSYTEAGFKRTNIILENDILPRLQTIESCYVTTYKRYQAGINQIDTMQADIDIIKKVVAEHSEQITQLQKIS